MDPYKKTTLRREWFCLLESCLREKIPGAYNWGLAKTPGWTVKGEDKSSLIF